MRHLIFVPAAVLLMGGAHVSQEPLSPVAQKIEAAIASDIRTDEERARDANRKPRETLEFLRLNDDMRVVELIPGGGWYTKILAPVLAENGDFHVAMGRRIGALQEQYPSLKDTVNILPVDVQLTPDPEIVGFFALSEFSLGIEDVDLVLTFRNLHNFTAESRAHLNKAAFDALKPGGLYGVVDHTRRHMQPDSRENWRRLDPVLAIQEIQATGFELVDFSDLHYRPDDELLYEVGRKTVQGNTDRFTLLFVKPE